eukprot:757560-Hanusia_phi.AAC.2
MLVLLRHAAPKEGTHSVAGGAAREAADASGAGEREEQSREQLGGGGDGFDAPCGPCDDLTEPEAAVHVRLRHQDDFQPRLAQTAALMLPGLDQTGTRHEDREGEEEEEDGG